MKVSRKSLPFEIQKKLNALDEEVKEIISCAHSHLKTTINSKLSLKFSGQGGRDILTEYERAQAICFSIKYQSLPRFNNRLTIEQHRQGKYFPKNIDSIRHILNEYRPLIQNQKDSVHYSNIHSFCLKKLSTQDNQQDLIIRALDSSGNDLTITLTKGLNERKMAIGKVLAQCEFNYLYNGILQHSDKKFSEKFLADYTSGNLHYLFIKHAKILPYIRDLLEWHYFIFENLTFPSMGSL
jgi:hypothetical protein